MQKRSLAFLSKISSEETIEDYKDLKENINRMEFFLSNPNVKLQYAEIKIKPEE
jgi:hypothetical protein